jgi:HK97 family phage prohead protease
MPMKSFAVTVKATAADDPALAEGQFTAFASVFNNIDAYGDVVMPGAFTDDLKTWAASGDVIPLYWGHRMDDPTMCIGSVADAQETDTGLLVKSQLDLETPNGAQVYRLLKGRRVSTMSFAYDVLDGGPGDRGDQKVYELRKLKLHEVSVVQVPANPAATVQDVKVAPAYTPGGDAAVTLNTGTTLVVPWLGSGTDPAEGRTVFDLKAGRSLSAKNEKALRAGLDKLTAAMTDVQSVLAVLDEADAPSDDGKAKPAQPATAEEPDGAKADEPARRGPASFRLRADLESALADEV